MDGPCGVKPVAEPRPKRLLAPEWSRTHPGDRPVRQLRTESPPRHSHASTTTACSHAGPSAFDSVHPSQSDLDNRWHMLSSHSQLSPDEPPLAPRREHG